MKPSAEQKTTREILPSDRALRISQRPFPSDLQRGMPIGHPNSAVAMSDPTIFRSSSDRISLETS